jgi:tetratricopeptide (TPR) repeat protein
MNELALKTLVISVLLLSFMAEAHGQKTADEWQSKAIELATSGNIEAAKIAFDEAIRLSPNDAFRPHIAGVTMAAKGDYKKAVDYFDEAVKINPLDDFSLLFKGDALQQLGKYDEAVDAYDASINIFSGSANAWSHKGNALLAQTGKEEEALRAFDASLRINPSDDHVWLNKGDALAALGQYDNAISAYKQVIKINSDNADAYNHIGLAYYNQRLFEEALKWFNAAIQKRPDYFAYKDWKCKTLWELSVNAGGGDWYEKYCDCEKDIGRVPNDPRNTGDSNQPIHPPGYVCNNPFCPCHSITISANVPRGSP